MKQESNLIKLVKKGDKKSIEILYRMNFQSLYVFIRRKVDSDERAEDICAEAFTKSFEKIGSFKEKSSYKTWLFTIANNLMIDWYRSKSNTSEFNEEFMSKEESRDDKKDITEGIILILNKLKENYRTVLELRFLSRLSINETAEIMKIKPNYVKVLQNRAINSAKEIALKSNI